LRRQRFNINQSEEQREMASLAGFRFGLAAAMTSWFLAACGWMPGYRWYWEARVREMCEKDGGVRIFERVLVTPAQVKTLPRVGSHLVVPEEGNAKPDTPVFRRISRTQIRDDDPPIVRHEETIVRRYDQRIVGVAVSYSWTPVEYPSSFIAHPAKMWCPDLEQIYEGIERVYRLEESAK
jgi:hypothetical protein